MRDSSGCVARACLPEKDKGCRVHSRHIRYPPQAKEKRSVLPLALRSFYRDVEKAAGTDAHGPHLSSFHYLASVDRMDGQSCPETNHVAQPM